MPEVPANYAGYVAWRGLVDEPELTDEAAALLRDRFSFFEYPNSHMLAYLVPGEHEAIEPGKRRYNWVWYRNAADHRLTELLIDADGRQHAYSIPPGLLSAESEADLREAAARHLPVATVQELVAKYTQGRVLGFLGEPAVNVLELNIALDQLSAKSGS